MVHNYEVWPCNVLRLYEFGVKIFISNSASANGGVKYLTNIHISHQYLRASSLAAGKRYEHFHSRSEMTMKNCLTAILQMHHKIFDDVQNPDISRSEVRWRSKLKTSPNIRHKIMNACPMFVRVYVALQNDALILPKSGCIKYIYLCI